MTEPHDRTLLPAAVWFVPAIMLLVALGDMRYGYYLLLRWITCGAFLLLLVQEHSLRGGASFWLILFALLAVLFNPLVPVHMTRAVWAPIDAGSALALAVHFLVCRRQATSAPGETRSASSRSISAKAATPSSGPPPKAPARKTNPVPDQGTDYNMLPAGYRLHEFEIVRVLGAGGFGVTYLAFDNNRKCPVAIKEYFYAGIAVRRRDGAVAPGSTQRAGDYEWGRARFLKEAQILSKLNHPNIVRVLWHFQENNTAYIVMDYVEGESLATFLERYGTLTPVQWQPWLEVLLEGLEHVHRNRYLHRDIKPENVVIRAADSQPVLVDFGAARRAAADKTQHLTAVHTPQYAPIEQYSTTSRQGPFTDIYSLAAVSYRALAGEPPSNAAERAIGDDYRPLTQRLNQRGDPVLATVDRALAVRAADRPQSVAAWRKLMREAVRQHAGSRHTTRTPQQPTSSPSSGSRKTTQRPGRRRPPRQTRNVAYPAGQPQRVREFFAAAKQGSTSDLMHLQQAAEHGCPWSQHCLGMLCLRGEHMQGDGTQAAEFFNEAAKQGLAAAQNNLGVLYCQGRGVTADQALATDWFNKAAEQGLVEASLNLDRLRKTGIAGKGSMEYLLVELFDDSPPSS